MGSVLNQQHASKVSFCTVMREWKYEVKWKIARVYRTVEVDVIRRTVWHPLPPPLLTLSILNIFCRRKEGLNHLIAFKYFLLSRLPHPHSLGSQAVFYPLFPWTVWQIQTNWLFFFFCPVLLRRGKQRWWRRAWEAAGAGRGGIPGFARNWPL